MANPMLLLAIVLVLAVVFDFINGFHDTANAVATVISTRVLSPFAAILMAAGLNFLGAVSGTEVAKTIGSGIVGNNVPQEVVIAALLAAIIWNLLTWYFGIPSSSSHALIGGLVGAAIAVSGFDNVHWNLLLQKVIIPFLASPVVGFFAGLLLIKLIFRLFARVSPARVGGLFRKSQVISSAFMAFSHGSNDAQKTMGIITLALISANVIPAKPFTVPVWVIALSALAMALGTAAGGKKIISTMGSKLVQLTPVQGFAAETAAASVIEAASRLGFPLSTTHIISSGILGVGAGKRFKTVRWVVAGRIIQTWMLTIPACVAISWTIYMFLILLGH